MCNKNFLPECTVTLQAPFLITSAVTGAPLPQRFKIFIKYLNCNNESI